MRLVTFLLLSTAALAQTEYDLVLRGGHVIDGKNGLSAVRDVAVRNGRIAAVAPKIDPAKTARSVDVTGLYVTPGLIDIHAHVYAGNERGSLSGGDGAVYPDGFTFRAGVTTVADAGGAGWRNVADFKERIIDRAGTRVLAFLNIVGHGMRGGKYEQNLEDMNASATGQCALENKSFVVGIKTAHYGGPEWAPVERAVEAGTIAKIPVMVDFGANFPQRPLHELLSTKLRPGDIYTHVYSGLRGELGEGGQPNPGLIEGRRRGVIFDVGHGGGSFAWRVAVPLMKAGFGPDSISTDLHTGSMNGGMKDMLNVMSKFLALGMPLEEVISRSTWHPAKEIQREDLGHLSVGAPADIAVLRLVNGNFGFMDTAGKRFAGNRKLICEMTVRDGKVVYDLNALAAQDWDKP